MTIDSIARVALLVSLAAGSAACRPPLQNGMIEVRSGADARFLALCRVRSGEAMCAPPAEDPAAAESDQPDGDETDAPATSSSGQ